MTGYQKMYVGNDKYEIWDSEGNIIAFCYSLENANIILDALNFVFKNK